MNGDKLARGGSRAGTRGEINGLQASAGLGAGIGNVGVVEGVVGILTGSRGDADEVVGTWKIDESLVEGFVGGAGVAGDGDRVAVAVKDFQVGVAAEVGEADLEGSGGESAKADDVVGVAVADEVGEGSGGGTEGSGGVEGVAQLVGEGGGGKRQGIAAVGTAAFDGDADKVGAGFEGDSAEAFGLVAASFGVGDRSPIKIQQGNISVGSSSQSLKAQVEAAADLGIDAPKVNAIV